MPSPATCMYWLPRSRLRNRLSIPESCIIAGRLACRAVPGRPVPCGDARSEVATLASAPRGGAGLLQSRLTPILYGGDSMKRLLTGLLLVLAALAAYLLLWPVPIAPVAWQAAMILSIAR